MPPARAARAAAAAPAAAPAAARTRIVEDVNNEHLEPRIALSADEVKMQMAYKIISQFKTPKDIRISVKGEYWERLPELRGRRLEGTVCQWARTGVALTVLWEDGRDTEYLDQLFHPEVELQFLPYANGKPAPRLTGRAYAREQREETDAAPKETVTIEYKDGSVTKQQVWTVESPQAIVTDQRQEEFTEPVLNRPLSTLNTPFKMWWNAACPRKLVAKMVTFFNQRLDGKDSSNPRSRKTTEGEVVRFICYMGALAVERGLPISDMWKFTRGPKDLRPPPSFGDHGMSKNRFEKLRELAGKLWELSHDGKQPHLDVKTEFFDPDDMWRWMRCPIDCFNEHYDEVLTQGSLTGPDETMIPYEGTVGPKPEQIPHSHFVPRKPKDTGAELNTQADAHARAIYRLDIERGEADIYPREFEPEWGYTTGLNFRLAKGMFDTNRIYAGDSRFMSVDAVEDLHMKGLYAIGDVKTKSSRYPVKKIQELCGPAAGDWCVMSSEFEDGFKIYAIGHRRGGEVHTFIASCGTTVEGEPQAYKEDMAVYGSSQPRKCPKVLNLWSKQQPTIDNNNRMRQSILAFEERFVTKSFPFRTLTTVLGIVFANAYGFYQKFISGTQYADSGGFLDFMRELTYDGMHNTIDGKPIPTASPAAGTAPETPSQRAAGSASPVRHSPRSVALTHKCIPLRSLPGYKGSRTQLCAVCQDNKHKTSWCCAHCSTPEKVFAVHPEEFAYKRDHVQYDCLAIHRSNPEDATHQKHKCIPSGRKRGGKRPRTTEAFGSDEEGSDEEE